jgi:hypothetical protein
MSDRTKGMISGMSDFKCLIFKWLILKWEDWAIAAGA